MCVWVFVLTSVEYSFPKELRIAMQRRGDRRLHRFLFYAKQRQRGYYYLFCHSRQHQMFDKSAIHNDYKWWMDLDRSLTSHSHLPDRNCYGIKWCPMLVYAKTSAHTMHSGTFDSRTYFYSVKFSAGHSLSSQSTWCHERTYQTILKICIFRCGYCLFFFLIFFSLCFQLPILLSFVCLIASIVRAYCCLRKSRGKKWWKTTIMGSASVREEWEQRNWCALARHALFFVVVINDDKVHNNKHNIMRAAYSYWLWVGAPCRHRTYISVCDLC